jgi:hypothetical protein
LVSVDNERPNLKGTGILAWLSTKKLSYKWGQTKLCQDTLILSISLLDFLTEVIVKVGFNQTEMGNYSAVQTVPRQRHQGQGIKVR